MKLTKTLALVVCWALLFTNSLSNSQTLDPTQVYTTNNLVNSGVDPTSTTSTWQNIGLWNQGLPCWGPGGPVYCGPQPYYNNGSFNFSYGLTDVYQSVNIANALPNSGTGLRVNGFNFGFTAKNGNGWDNGQQDYLAAYVNVYDSSGNIVRQYDYSLWTNQKYDWTVFNFSESFNKPYATKDLSSVRYGFVGYDTNFWAGPYGPEIYNVNFSLKYSVDPCFVDVLSSPNCPGYLEKINSLSAIPNAPSFSPTTVTQTNTQSSPMTATVTENVQSPASSNTTSTSAPIATLSTSTASVTPTATNPQPKVGEITVSGSAPKVSTATILSIVRNEQTRISNLETATAQEAITQAQQQANAAQSESLSISANTVSRSVGSSQTVISSTRPENIYSLAFGLSTSNQLTSNTTIASANTSQIRLNAPINMTIEENSKTENTRISFGADPIRDIINARPTIPSETVETKTASVNQKAQDNELSGGVSISSIAKQPIGFEKYSNNMQDAAFYAPKEIYRNQRVVDNARLQRSLTGSSDRIHQEMVDQQYKLGN